LGIVGGKMDKNLLETTLRKVRETSPKRNFKQSIDLIVNLKGLDLKKPDHQVNMFVTLHNSTGKKISVCALVGPELETKAKEVCDEVIPLEQFDRLKGKSEIKKLANKHDFFIAQANIMPKIATVFGRFLGPRGKMPNPKIGSILPPNGNVKSIYDKLGKTACLMTKNEPTIKCIVGKEGMGDDAIIDNILAIYTSLIQKLPNEAQNIKSVMLKLTMGPSFIVGDEPKIASDRPGISSKNASKRQSGQKKEVKSDLKREEEKSSKEK
jgi:large subunit ribosomal protein L1